MIDGRVDDDAQMGEALQRPEYGEETGLCRSIMSGGRLHLL